MEFVTSFSSIQKASTLMSLVGKSLPQRLSLLSDPILRLPLFTSTMPKGAGSAMDVPLTPVTSPPAAVAPPFAEKHEATASAAVSVHIANIIFFIIFIYVYVSDVFVVYYSEYVFFIAI